MRPLLVFLLFFFITSLTVRARIDSSKKPEIEYHYSEENIAYGAQIIAVPKLPCPEGLRDGHSGECRPVFGYTTKKPRAVITCPEGYRVGHTGDCRPVFGYTTKGPRAVITREPCPEGYGVGNAGDCRPIFGYTTKGN